MCCSFCLLPIGRLKMEVVETALGKQQSLSGTPFGKVDKPNDDLVISRLMPRHDVACKPCQSIIDARNTPFFAPRRPLKPVALVFREVEGSLFLPRREHSDAKVYSGIKTGKQTRSLFE